MDPLLNPFSPGAGSPPPELAGRGELLEQARITLGRVKAGRFEQSVMLVGLRGVGKTVLLNRIRELAEDDGYGVAMIEATEGRSLPELLVPPLRQLLFRFDAMAGVSQKVKRGLRVLRSFLSGVKVKVAEVEIGMDAEKGTADSGDLEADLGELFLAVAEAAQDRNTAVAVIIDEIQYLDEMEMSALIMAVHKTSQRQAPLVLFGAGLPQLVGLTGRSKSYAERLFRFPEVGPLSALEAAEALQGPARAQGVAFTPEALARLGEVTQGYPYFLQEWGSQAWNIAPQSPIDHVAVAQATEAALKKLDQSFFRVRFDRLTPREKEYLRALADLGPGPQRSGDVADALAVKIQTVAPLRSGLIKKGMIYSPAHGDTAFTVPLFDQFMRRTMPDWTRPGHNSAWSKKSSPPAGA